MNTLAVAVVELRGLEPLRIVGKLDLTCGRGISRYQPVLPVTCGNRST